MLPALEQRLVDVALVELGVADQRHHAPLLGSGLVPAARLHVVLHQAREGGHGDAEADRAGREVDVVGVLGARRVGLRAAHGAKALEMLAALPAEQILDGVEHRAGVRLHRHPVLGPQDGEVERGHDGGQRSTRGLMAADLQPVDIPAAVVGMVDGLRGQPQELPLQIAQGFYGQVLGHEGAEVRGSCMRSDFATHRQAEHAKLLRVWHALWH